MEKQILSICEAVWRLGRGTALDLPLDPELTPEDATDKIMAIIANEFGRGFNLGKTKAFTDIFGDVSRYKVEFESDKVIMEIPREAFNNFQQHGKDKS